MTQIEESLNIKAPLEAVFQALTDPRRTVEWNPNIIEVSDVEHPVRVGSSWRQVTMVAGRRMNLNCRVERYEPPHVGVLHISGDQTGKTWTKCQAVDGTTRVSQGIEFEVPAGMFGRVAAGFARGMLQRELAHTMARQRDILEREAGASGGSKSAG
jgi:uncharacterized protein YndB with AHSA1/START domain